MKTEGSVPQPETEPGIATAEQGFVILDGPDGVAVTMTPEAASLTGHSLMSAARLAHEQASAGSR